MDIINLENKNDEYVYDISLDGTFVNALGFNVLANTDGFNFKTPEKSEYRYTEENPYIGKGLSRETKEGEKYIEYDADLAEFNDLYMVDPHYSEKGVCKIGCGLDEKIHFSINISRKNYLDYFPDKPYPEDVKKVGNTVKSKKMPGYIATFLDKAVRLLLQNNGRDFLEEYYDYIEKIYNYKIPLRDIASKGKVKKTIPDYIEDCKTITKAGRPKSRQAWMELAVRDNVKVNIGDTLYYINTGKSKSHSDCKKLRKFYRTTQSLFGDEETECTAQIEREYKAYCKENKAETSISDYISKYHKDVRMREEIVLNCQLLPVSMVEADEDTFCDSQTKYNVAKYIAQFNSRINPLLVCFSKSIRDKILITNPSGRKYFTEEEAALTSGEPNKESDQDTYEQLMTMDDREIRFWMNHPEWKIPFLEECGMNWDEIKKDYLERMERERQLGIDKVREAYDEALKSITEDEYNDYVENGKLPRSIDKLVYVDPVTGYFMDRTYTDVKIGSIYDIIEYMELSGEDFEEDE